MSNTSSMHDDQIVARCCAIPLSAPSESLIMEESSVDDGLGTFDLLVPMLSDDSLRVFLLNVQSSPSHHLRVMSGHLQPINHDIVPYDRSISIVKLYPGESIKIILIARKATGLENVKHCPAHAFHRRSSTGAIELFVRSNGSHDAKELVQEALSLMHKQ
jgi:hypothetical protein